MTPGLPIAWLARTDPAPSADDARAPGRPSGAWGGGSWLRRVALLAGVVVALALLRWLLSGGADGMDGTGDADGSDGGGGMGDDGDGDADAESGSDADPASQSEGRERPPRTAAAAGMARKVGWFVAIAVTSIALGELRRRLAAGPDSS